MTKTGPAIGVEVLFAQFWNPADTSQTLQVFVTVTNAAGRLRIRSVSNVPARSATITITGPQAQVIDVPTGIWPGPTTTDTQLLPNGITLANTSLSSPNWSG